MNAIRDRLKPQQEGFTLVEVVIAMFIFTLVMTGSLYAMISVLQVTRDNRASQVASNLAAEQIDLSRDIEDLFDLVPDKREVVVNGDTFTVAWDTSWVSDVGDIQCATGGGALRYKRVNVTVTWANMRPGAPAIHSDTVIDSRNRINDPSLGTILVSVLGPVGTGAPGVTVTAEPSDVAGNTAANITEPIAKTDSEGCSYILKVKPGYYDITVERANYIDLAQKTPSTLLKQKVEAGASLGAAFSYAEVGTVNLNFAGLGTRYKLPNALDLSFMNTTRSFTTTRPVTNSLKVFPFDAGYEVLAGKHQPKSEGSDGCVSVDPLAWPSVKRSGDTYVGSRPVAASPDPAGIDVAKMAMATVQVPAVANTTLIAETAASPSSTGDPGCSVSMRYVYTFTDADVLSGRAVIALPYGSWTLFSLGTFLGLGGVSVIGGGIGHVHGSVLTVDPRIVKQ